MLHKSRDRIIWPLILLLLVIGRQGTTAGETNLPAAIPQIDMGTPSVMTGTFYEIGSDRKKVLFKYRRAATRDGEVIHVEQTFSRPDGAVACREHIRYQNNELVSYAMEDVPAAIRGRIVIVRDPKKPRADHIMLDFIEGRKEEEKTKKTSEKMEKNTLIADTIYPHILAHWDELMAGTIVKFQFISLDPATTFGFRLVKENNTEWQGHPSVRVKMEPSNFIVARLINPIYFIIETAPPHRIFSYIGRTTPRALVNGSWKPVDAEAVFDWP
jgi:hypothetical protein